jgi:hypothetical protein
VLEQLRNVEPSRIDGVGRDSIELFNDQTCGVALLQVIDKLDCTPGLLASAATNSPVPTPTGGEMPEPPMDGKGKKPTSKSCTVWTISGTSYVPVGSIAASPE